MAMESPSSQTPLNGSTTSLSVQSAGSRSSTNIRLADDVTILTSFGNPFAEEDELDPAHYNLVTSFFSKMKSISDSFSSAVTSTSTTSGTAHTTASSALGASELRRPSVTTAPTSSSNISNKTSSDRPHSLFTAPSQIAPPLVSLTPAQSELPTFSLEYEQGAPRPGSAGPYSPFDPSEAGQFGTSIPGFPIPDDTRSIKTSTSFHRSNSVSKAMRKIRGEGLSRDYWMDDENAKECYDCKSVFTTWRRKHHCRICGQIFCSRCASNVIKGLRFGHDGMIRVCNLCLEKLAIVDEGDDDDRRSVASSTFPAHQLGQAITPGRQPSSPFPVAQFFGRSDDAFNFFNITGNRPSVYGYGSEGTDSRPMSPYLIDGPEPPWETAHDNPAPFRRAMSDDDDGDSNGLSNSIPAQDENATSSKNGIDIPSKPLNVDVSVSSIQFPLASPELDSPRPESRNRMSIPFYGEYEPGTPFIRSRVQSRLDAIQTAGEPVWRKRRDSIAYQNQLNNASNHHLQSMLNQMLTIEGIPNILEWQDVLLHLALQISKDTTFTALPLKQSQDNDIRRYVKIKKIPGGKPKDSEYVQGAVITKNVAHKQMSRVVNNPRVMLVTFPLEFHRVEGQYMHFGQIVRQEKEYLTNLASRIAALRPHVVLVEKSVSRIALDALAKHNIAVARTVKPSAIHTIARMTQGDVFSSMDKLALEPRLGHCRRFKIQTFDHHLIPGQRKTYMRFEGCSPDMGCTIILRGGNIETLRKIKKVTRFLIFVVRNLKLEFHLWKDTVIDLEPKAANDQHKHSASQSLTSLPSSLTSTSIVIPTPKTAKIEPVEEDEDEDVKEPGVVDEEAEQKRLSQRVQDALEPYQKTFLSVSATLRFPAPYPIQRMKDLDDELISAKRAWEDEVIRSEEQIQVKHQQEATIVPAATITTVHDLEQQQEQASLAPEDISAQIEALPSSRLTLSPADLYPVFRSPAPMEEGDSYFPPMNSTHPTVNLLNAATPEPEAKAPLKTMDDIALQSRFSLLKSKHEEHRRIWEWYLRKNKDDFVVEKYQCISWREFTIPVNGLETNRPCFHPTLKYITFYGENDLTLGQFIEKSITDTLVQFLDPKAICQGKACDQPLARHGKVFVHNSTRIFFFVEQWDKEIVKVKSGRALTYNPPEVVATWTVCRKCGGATPFIPVSEEVLRYSFAKFLEAYFYPADVKLVSGAGCQHNIYEHHVRFFASRGMTIQFQADPITLQELVFPPFRIRVRPETQLEIKNREFNLLHQRNNRWYSGLIDDLKKYAIEASTGDEDSDARLINEINTLIGKAEVERKDVVRLINKIYNDSALTDTLALNQVHAYRQDKIVAWQMDFDKLPRLRSSQTDSRPSKRSSGFSGSVRGLWKYEFPDITGAFSDSHPQSSNVSEAEEGPIKPRRLTGESFASSASDVSESESALTKSSQLEKPEQVDDQPPLPSSAVPSSGVAEPDAPPNDTPSQADTPATPSVEIKESDADKAESEKQDSDPESDDTIGAAHGPRGVAESRRLNIPDLPATEVPVSRLSRLPRRAQPQPNVAELVKKYSDYIPPQGVQELTKTAFPPRSNTMSESEQEYPTTTVARRTGPRSRKHLIARKPSTSDFEQGYAANVVARLPRSRRLASGATSGFEAQVSSGRPSPDKRSSHSKSKNKDVASRQSSPTRRLPRERPSKIRVPSFAKDKLPSRTPSVAPPKSTLRRAIPPNTPGGKVSNIAKHFERLNRDSERPKGKYSVLRLGGSKRARPVTTLARARVEVLDSIKDAIRDEDEDENSDQSEADDEGDDMEEELPSNPPPKSSLDEVEQPEGSAGPTSAEEPETPVPETPISDVTAPSTASTIVEGLGASQELIVPPAPDVAAIPPSPFLAPIKSKTEPALTPPMSTSDNELGDQRISILKALSTLWPQQPHQFDDPFGDPEHIFRDSDMVVRLDEPTSIIALALNSPQYREMLAKSRADKQRTGRADPTLFEGTEAFMPDDGSVAESTSTWGVVNVDAVETIDPTEDPRSFSSKLPWAITFESGGLTISCTVLYPEQFDAIRRMFDCEKSIVESLARCVKWKAGGGKSGSAFLKTQDDRFIAKELSRAELQTMETFAPAYFDYMSSAVAANRPTLLAKVFGCYKLTFKRTAAKDRGSGKSKSTQMNLLVMENLFYNRRFARIYDLKGSTRNRHVQPTGQENEVLLDENLVEAAHTNPFYLREHSKRILRGALYNDSKFLADINVMDYSLVSGVDSNTNELVLGIVDYIRTYTWDKKLESWVKESTFLGGAGKGEPTIVTPKQYRQRFLGAMERYFPLVPDRWMKHKDAPEEDTSSLSELWPDW